MKLKKMIQLQIETADGKYCGNCAYVVELESGMERDWNCVIFEDLEHDKDHCPLRHKYCTASEVIQPNTSNDISQSEPLSSLYEQTRVLYEQHLAAIDGLVDNYINRRLLECQQDAELNDLQQEALHIRQFLIKTTPLEWSVDGDKLKIKYCFKHEPAAAQFVIDTGLGESSTVQSLWDSSGGKDENSINS